MTRRTKTILGLAVLFASTLWSCGSLVRNPDVSRWCGAGPCDWKVTGKVKRVSTWHPNDYAVELVSDDATLTQENATIDYLDSDCFRFSMVANIPHGVRVYLELDFLADGSVEFSQRLPVSDWRRRTFKVTAPDWYRKVRFIIRKDGPGRAAFAEISAENANGECTAPPVMLLDRPDGARCSSGDQCTSGACSAGRCSGCVNDSDCAAEEICALTQSEPEGQRYDGCVAAAQTPLGSGCSRDEQCASGVCADGACSECALDADCDAGPCVAALNKPPNTRFWPKLCAAGKGTRASDATCTSDQDCKSSECQGFDVTCQVGTGCRYNDESCLTCAPMLQFGACH